VPDKNKAFVGAQSLTPPNCYGRTVGELFADGINVQQAMVASGHAQIYWKYAKPCAWAR